MTLSHSPDPKDLLKALIVVVVGLILVFWGFRCARAEVNYPNNLWQGIIGEAVSEGYQGMYAVACVYKNRLEKGMSLGCVALKRKDLDRFVKRQGGKYERMAKDIIRKVFLEDAPDISQGATHYENIERFGIPWWTKDMIRTVKIGRHTFYCKLTHK